jgi:hypothetical protein
MGDRERLAAVESENAELKGRLAALEAKVSPKPRQIAPVEENVRVTILAPGHGVDLPTPEQFEELLEIVARSHPTIVPAWPENRWGSHLSDRQRYTTAFIQCFKWLADLWRFNGAELGNRRADHWVVDAGRIFGAGADIQLSHMLAAAIAWSDVNVGASADRRWFTHLGLSYSTGEGIRRASSESWRKVLSTGELRKIITTDRQELYTAPTPRIQQLQIRG